MTEEPAWGIRRNERGVNALGKLEDGKRVSVVLNEPHVRQGDEPTLDDLREALIAVYGTDFGVHDVTCALEVHRCGPAGGVLPGETGAPGRRRGARAFPDGRTGTQPRCPGRREPGMEAGPGGQRHIAGEPARHLPGRAAPDRCARAQEHHGGNGAQPRRRTDEGLARDHVRAAPDGRASQAIRRDDVGSGHSLRPRHRDTRCSGAACPISTSSPKAAHGGSSPCCTMPDRYCSISVSPAPSTSLRRAADRVKRVDARYAGAWELPVLGAVAAPTAVLIRPDGHVAWVGDGTDQGLRDALTTWFGPPNHGSRRRGRR